MEDKQNKYIEIVHKLKILSTLREHDRVQTRSGLFVARSTAVLQGVSRWFSNETRQKNIEAITKIIREALSLCKSELSARRELLRGDDSLLLLKNSQVLKRLKTEISYAMIGVLNLKTTYSADSHTCSKIEIIHEFVEDELEQIDLEIKNN